MNKFKKNIGKVFLLYCFVAFLILYSILLYPIEYVIIAIIPVAIVLMIINKGNILARIGFFLLAVFRVKNLFNKIASKAVEYGTTYNNALAPYGFHLIKNYRFKEAKRIYEDMLTRPMNLQLRKVILGNLGVVHWKLNEYEDAIGVYEQIVLDPVYMNQVSAGDYATLGFICMEAGDYEKGESYTNDALQLTPDYPAALDNYGQMYYMQGDYEKAEDYLLQALIQKPTMADSNYYLGCIYESRGEIEHAKEYYDNVSKLNVTALNTITNEMVQDKLGLYEK